MIAIGRREILAAVAAVFVVHMLDRIIAGIVALQMGTAS